jgi:antitoxin (DNA-binding transcriptional repressor) of toxin-antitoxin stability system
MQRISIAEAAQDFPGLVDRVRIEGESFELTLNDAVIACLAPANGKHTLKARDFKAFLAGLPKLGDDAEAFGRDLDAIRREFPMEKDSWD